MIGKLLAIDHGVARIGLAVSDALGISARELAIVQRQNDEADFAAINQAASRENVIGFVAGIPYNTGYATETQAQLVRRWLEGFRQTTALPIVTWDETGTSQEAAELARQARRGVRDAVDDLAARVILQSFLDALNDGLATFP